MHPVVETRTRPFQPRAAIISLICVFIDSVPQVPQPGFAGFILPDICADKNMARIGRYTFFHHSGSFIFINPS
jgi:hypothetical protein